MELGGLTNDFFYSLSVDLLFYDRDLLITPLSDRMQSFLADFMGERGEWKKLSELNPAHKTNPDYHVKALMRDMELDGFFFGKGISYQDGEPIGINMDQRIAIEYKENPAYFQKLFPFRLIQVCRDNRKWMQPKSADERLGELLKFHLDHSFDNNLNKYRAFLLSLEYSSGDIVMGFMDSIKLWIDSQLSNPIFISQGGGGIIKDAIIPKTLKEIFGEDYELCVSALQNVTPPILNSDRKFSIGERDKSAIAIWWEVCKTRGKVNQQPTLKILSEVVNTEFGIKISPTTLSGTNDGTATSKYKNQLLNLIR